MFVRRSAVEPAQEEGARRASKTGRKGSMLKKKRASSESITSSNPASPVSAGDGYSNPSSPSAAVPDSPASSSVSPTAGGQGRFFNKRQSDLFQATNIDIDAEQ